MHIFGKQTCKIRSLAKFAYSFSKSKEPIRYLTTAARAEKLYFISFTSAFSKTYGIWTILERFPGINMVIRIH